MSGEGSGGCHHGGDFFAAIGPRFDRLERLGDVISADVLDAWFPPAPQVLDLLREHLAWSLATSPPTACEGMRAAVAEARGVAEAAVLPTAGSSDAIFLALPRWLDKGSRVLLLDPMYGEYRWVLERLVGCRVETLPLSRGAGWEVDLGDLASRLAAGYDMAVLVNPNSPTGRHVPGEGLERLLRAAPPETRVWVDETYVEYVGGGESLERFAAGSDNVVVCKSMSKAYALSGVRCGYLCGPPRLLDGLRALAPPWSVSLPGQMAAVVALGAGAYYEEKWEATRVLRAALARGLAALGMEVVPGVANFLLVHLPLSGPRAETLIARCRDLGLFLRDPRSMGAAMDDWSFRIAVKDAATNARMVGIISECLAEAGA